MAYSSSVTIEELNVGGGKQPRSVLLVGAGLPFQGAEWGTEAQIITTWYPGNGDEATQQTLGPRELPSSWEGEWRRTMLPRSGCKITDDAGQVSDVFAPQQLRDAFDEMFREGHRLRVTWRVVSDGQSGQDNVNGTLVREGRCKSWKFPHTRLQDINWTFEFAWQSRGKRVQKPISARDASMITAIAGLNAAQADLVSKTNAKLLASNNNIRKSANHFTLGQLESLASFPNDLMKAFTRSAQRQINTLKQLGDIANKLRSLPFQVSNTAVDFARNAIAQANQFIDTISRQSPEQQSLKSGVADLTRAATYFGTVIDVTAVATLRAATLEDQMRAVINVQAPLRGRTSPKQNSGTRRGDIIAVYVTKTGDTPTRISLKFYGSPDFSLDIMKANRLPWYQATFPAGKPLIIPALQTAIGQTGV